VRGEDVLVIDVTLLGKNGKFFVIAGPCVIEGSDFLLKTAKIIKGITDELGIPLVFKSSYDKANRTSVKGFRGPGMKKGLATLASVKKKLGVPVLTDVHEIDEVLAASKVADVLQIPAFLSRQTSLLVEAARRGKAVNVKKGQFLAPKDMKHVVSKIADAGNDSILVTERGVSFGYNDLVVDMRALPMLRELGYPVVFDVTHSLQLPGAGDCVTAGLAQYIEPLASAGVAAGVDAVFMEVHSNPSVAKSDAANALRLDLLEPLIMKLKRIDAAARETATAASGARA